MLLHMRLLRVIDSIAQQRTPKVAAGACGVLILLQVPAYTGQLEAACSNRAGGGGSGGGGNSSSWVRAIGRLTCPGASGTL
jgi:hypothetical protein